MSTSSGDSPGGRWCGRTRGVAATHVANNTWMLVATFLVFIMHLGFASLKPG